MGILNRFKNLITLTPSTNIEILDLTKRQRSQLMEYGALFSIAYLACEQVKARSLASLPVAVYERDAGVRAQVDDHPLTRLFTGQANDLMSGRDLRHWLSVRRDTFGNANIFVEWKRGEPVALWPITSPVSIDYNAHARAGRRLRYIINEGDSFVPAGKYFADEVISIRTALTKDGINGMSIAELAARDIGLSVDLEQFYQSMLENGNHQLGHVEIPADKMYEKARESIERAIAAKTGPANAGKAPIFGYGAKWVTDQQTMKDASLIEMQTWVLQQVCRACCVPPSKVYDITSNSYSSAEAARTDYASDTIAPEAAVIETAFKPVLESMGHSGYYLHFDLNGIMRGDVTARGQFYREMVYMGAMTRNEVRAKEEMNPLKGLDDPLVPVNYGLVDSNGEVTVLTSGNKEPADGMQTATTDKEQ